MVFLIIDGLLEKEGEEGGSFFALKWVTKTQHSTKDVYLHIF